MENRRIGHGYLIAAMVAVTVLLSACILAFGGKADAAGTLYQPNQQAPYGGCKEANVNVHSDGARWCRQHGWIVMKRLLVSPNGKASTGLPRCKSEDASGVSCYWNSLARGNGNGHGFIALPGRTVYVDKINGRWATSKKDREGYWIAVPWAG